MNELFAAARDFYNMTIADTDVLIRTADKEKRDQIVIAGERLRAAIEAHPAQAGGGGGGG